MTQLVLSQPMALQIVVFIAALAMLVRGSDVFVDGASVIAKRFGVSDLFIGLTIVAMGTSAPEFAVSGYAAMEGAGDISLGNVVGSNIFNLGFILALCAIIRPMSINRSMFYRDGTVLVLACIALGLAFLPDRLIDRIEGMMLVFMLGLYLAVLAKTSRNEYASHVPAGDASLPRSLIFVALGLAGLLIGSKLMVDLASNFARSFGVSEWLIGVTIVAVGTSLPELFTALASVMKDKSEIGIGGLLGSDIFNILGVMGVASILRPIPVSPSSYNPYFVMVGTMVLLGLLLRIGFRLTRRDGVIILGISLLRFSYEFFQ